MIYALRAGMLALAMIALLNTGSLTEARELGTSANRQVIAIPSLDLGRIERTLNLTPEQKVHWPMVKSALRGLSRSAASAASGSPGGQIAALHRLAIAARPLIAVLTEDQKAAARALAAEMGLGSIVVAALN